MSAEFDSRKDSHGVFPSTRWGELYFESSNHWEGRVFFIWVLGERWEGGAQRVQGPYEGTVIMVTKEDHSRLKQLPYYNTITRVACSHENLHNEQFFTFMLLSITIS